VLIPTPTAMGSLRWPVPQLDTVEDLAGWLGLTAGELDWFADRRGWERTAGDERLRHYRGSWQRKHGGGLRLIESPKWRLKLLQRRLLDTLLEPIPPHEAAHGFRRGRSVTSLAAPHVGRHVVIHLDLEAFFAAVTGARTYGIFRTAGYAEPVAHALTALMTTVTSLAVGQAAPSPTASTDLDARFRLGRALAVPHLPQGAPSSPALANLAAYRLDRRLAGLASSWGARYTRYADDLAFSGDRDLRRAASTFTALVRQVVADEGFRLHARKTTVTGPGRRQQLAGIVVNQRATIARSEVDRLRATLHNATRTGPQAQNRSGHRDYRGHLLGRVTWVESVDPARGARLRAEFELIQW